MSYITNELSERIGRIDDNGYVFDNMGDCFAQITDSGYITAVAGWDTYGKIDEDGTIRDASMDVIGRIQADGYIYIHSRRVGKVSSAFVEKLLPTHGIQVRPLPTMADTPLFRMTVTVLPILWIFCFLPSS